MPKADATGLAPKKSADTTLPYPIRRCGRVWLPLRPANVPASGKLLSADVSNQKLNPFLWWSLGAEALGFKTRRPPGRLCRALQMGFPRRDTGQCLHGGVSYPTLTHSAPSFVWSGRTGFWEITRKLAWEPRGERSWPITIRALFIPQRAPHSAHDETGWSSRSHQHVRPAFMPCEKQFECHTAMVQMKRVDGCRIDEPRQVGESGQLFSRVVARGPLESR